MVKPKQYIALYTAKVYQLHICRAAFDNKHVVSKAWVLELAQCKDFATRTTVAKRMLFHTASISSIMSSSKPAYVAVCRDY